MKHMLYSLGLCIVVWPALLLAEDPRASGEQMRQIQTELERLKEENARTRARMEDLEKQLGALRQENAAKSAELEQKVETIRPTTSSLSEALDGYWGEHRFVLTGNGNALYHWAGRGEANTFSAAVDPILLYRLSDRAFFSAEVEFELAEQGETEVNLEYAQFNYLLNRYTTLVAGKYLLPFGEFIERIHPVWINKLATQPLPLREEGGLLPFSEIGAQVRGGISLAAEAGVDLDYTLFVANGPRFTSAERGAAVETNNIDTNRGKAFGVRLGLRPLPFSWQSGRWKIGASTYNGTWDDKDNRWIYTWGLDTTYQYGPWELRGEYLNLLRELPGAVGHEHREGWYLQGAYKLLRFATVPILNRSELIFRYSRQNQPRNLEEEELFLRGSQYSIGYDYWLSPTVVWKLEYDFDERRDQPNNHEIFTQIAVGF